MKHHINDMKRRALHNADAAYYVLDYLAHSFPVQLYEPFTDSEGKLSSRPVMRDGQPVECREAARRRDALIEKLAGLPCPGIEVLGEVPAARFFDLMLATDIVTMPSYDEPFGLIAQEAMLLRKLLVLSGTGGLVEFTGPDCALVIEPKNIDSLLQGLAEALELLKAPDLLQQKLKRADERVAAFFPPLVTGQLESVYDLARGLEQVLDA